MYIYFKSLSLEFRGTYSFTLLGFGCFGPKVIFIIVYPNIFSPQNPQIAFIIINVKLM